MIVNLIVPPATELYDPSAYPSLGLLYLGAALKKINYECRYIDLSEGMMDVPEADYHMITVLQSTYKTALTIRNSIKSGKVIIGGIMPTLIPDKALKDFNCTVVTGEAEQSMEVVMRSINEGKKIINCGVVDNLDLSPFPDRDLIPLDKLRNIAGQHVARCSGDGASTTMIFSRGCPFKCGFCSKSPQTNYFRFRSAANVFSEMKELRDKYNISHVRFLDDSFTVNKTNTYSLCSLLRGQGFYWLCMTRTDLINRDLLQKMYDAGCRDIQFGIESGSQRILDIMHKGTKVEQNIKAVRLAEEIGISVKVLLMENYYTETDEDRILTMKFVEESQPSKWALTSYVPLYGTEFEGDAVLGGGYFYENEDSLMKAWLRSEVWRKR